MAILDILTAPHPILELKARAVETDEFGADLERLTSDMAETMYAAPGVGLAAPQVGDARRIIVVDSGDDTEGTTGLLKMINPVIVARSQDTIPWRETCLSVPEFDIEVQRTRHITVEWQTPAGEHRSQAFHDFESVILQHELDHLEGTVLLDRASRFRRNRYVQRVRKLRKATVRG